MFGNYNSKDEGSTVTPVAVFVGDSAPHHRLSPGGLILVLLFCLAADDVHWRRRQHDGESPLCAWVRGDACMK